MRRILKITQLGLTALTATLRSFPKTQVAAGMLACVGTQASAQQSAFQPVQTAGGLLSGGGRPGGPSNSVSDASYFGTRNANLVKPSSYIGDVGYQQLCAAETMPNAYCGDAGCNVNWYFNFDAMFLRREGDRRFTLSQNNFLDNADFEFGGRYTIGKMCDCVNAYEFVYAGPFGWNRSNDVVGTNIDSRFIDTPSILDDAFNDATSHSQRWNSDLNSVEINRRWWAWDAISTLVGVRYLRYEEQYTLTALRPVAPTSGLYRDDITNDMLGLQIGGDLIYPTSLKTTVSVRGKAALMANFASREVDVFHNGALLLRNAEDDVDLSGLIEIGVNGTYQVTPSFGLTAGYEAWFLPAVATVPKQYPFALSLSSGTGVRMSDDIVLHGFRLGAQLLY
jgi:hypothetical protein